MITSRLYLKLAFPIILSNATVPLVGVVDTAVVGQLGDATSIGAVGLGAIIITSIYWLFGFLRMGATGLVAQAVGQESHYEVSAILMRFLIVGFVAGMVIWMTKTIWLSGFLLIAPGSEQVEELTNGYVSGRVLGAPALISLYGLTGWLIATQRMKEVFVLQIVMNAINIGLSVWFVLRLELGVEGVALATVTAEWISFLLALYMCRTAFFPDGGHSLIIILEKKRLLSMYRIGADIFIRSALIKATLVSFLFISAGMGDQVLAANQILIQFLHVMSFALDGLAHTTESLVGVAVGARNRSAVSRAASMSLIWSAVFATAMALGLFLYGEALISLMTTSTDVEIGARGSLAYVILAPLLGVLAWVLDGVFLGATRSKDLRNMTLVAFCVYVLALVLLVPPLGSDGLWAAFLVSLVARGAAMATRYRPLLLDVN